MNNCVLIAGYGFVGRGAYAMLSRRYDVAVHDPYAADLPNPVALDHPCSLAVVCVPSPTCPEDGSCDTSIVEDVVRGLNAEVVLIKSTIPPGTTERLAAETGKRLVFSPEYMGESKYDNTFQYMHTAMERVPFVVLGGPPEDRDYVHDKLLPIVGPEKRWFLMTSREAELVKYMENAYFALKVGFVNEAYDLAQAFGCHWETVRQAWTADPRVEPMHTAVFLDDRGFRGKCFPKDVNALVAAARKMNFTPKILSALLSANDGWTAPEPVEERELETVVS